MTLIGLHLSTFSLEDLSLSHIVLYYVTSFGQLENGKCYLGKGLKRAYVLRLPGNPLLWEGLLPVCEMLKLRRSLPAAMELTSTFTSRSLPKKPSS